MMKSLRAFLGLGEGGSTPSPTTIGSGLVVKGELRGAGMVTIHGQFEGDIVLDGTLHIGPEGRVDANVTAHAIVVAGELRGNLSADTEVEILPTGALTGTVKSAGFTAADGAAVKSEIWLEHRLRPEGQP
jgi:cytoskeletal protein CcmA (bactofilin family)